MATVNQLARANDRKNKTRTTLTRTKNNGPIQSGAICPGTNLSITKKNGAG